jgi:hypothetical protein
MRVLLGLVLVAAALTTLPTGCASRCDVAACLFSLQLRVVDAANLPVTAFHGVAHRDRGDEPFSCGEASLPGAPPTFDCFGANGVSFDGEDDVHTVEVVSEDGSQAALVDVEAYVRDHRPTGDSCNADCWNPDIEVALAAAP